MVRSPSWNRLGFPARGWLLRKSPRSESAGVSSSQFQSSRGSSRGVLLIGHGTRDQVGTEQFFELSRVLARRLSPLPVAAGLLEFQSPTIDQAWNQLVAAGVDHIHVAPLLLFAAGHAREDIPAAIQRCQCATPTVTFDQALPLSRHGAVVELAVERVHTVRGEHECPAGDACRTTALLVVGRGSRDPCAQADLRVLAELIRCRLPAAHSWTAFYAMAQPRFGDVLTQLAADGRFTRIIVYPHLLFEGRIHQSILRQCRETAQRFPGVAVDCCRYLGPESQIAEALAARVELANQQVALRDSA